MDIVKQGNNNGGQPKVIDLSKMTFDELVKFLMEVWGYDETRAIGRANITLGLGEGDEIEVKRGG